jgi:hypothetical protein
MLKDEVAKVRDKTLKLVLKDIIETSKDYIREEHMPRAVAQQLDAVELFLYSPFLQQVAYTSRLVFDTVNENKLSNLYAALGQYLETKTLPQNYEKIRSVNLESSSKPLSALAVA